MMGHTDKATVNERRPLTPGMLATLKGLAREPFVSDGWTSTATKNQLRALMDRGYAYPDNGGNPWRITDAGRGALPVETRVTGYREPRYPGEAKSRREIRERVDPVPVHRP